MKIRVITSCTGEKRHSPEGQLTQAEFRSLHDTQAFQAFENNLEEFRTLAETIYTGQQHVRLMQGINQLREKFSVDSVDLWIVSAGYGLIPGDKAVVPYECTFQGMNSKDLRAWADHLHVAEDIRPLFAAADADLVLVLLGDPYLRALRLDDQVQFASPTLFFTGDNAQKQVKGTGKLRIVPLTNQEAKRFSCGLVGLKGEIAKRLLNRIVENGSDTLSALFDPVTNVLKLLDNAPKEASPKVVAQPSVVQKVKPKAAQANPKVDQVIQIPESWWDKPHRTKLRYFIPEWDDLVDPDYDFENDTHSGGQGDWSNETYAHQMYSEPNYDGILVSKVVAEKSKKKKERINALGVHRYLRVPREFPIMGDCGAFGYIKDEVPPYTTSEILDYYTRLGFDYGVSLDHLIVASTGDQRQFRYELTIHNAEEFLQEHRKRGLTWEPIGAVQGWDPGSYANAARQYVDMGYQYIGLGGLVRTNTAEILRVVQAVHQVIPQTVNIHLFGLARLNALKDFVRLGVRSVDSASFLRRAWLGSGKNYLTEEGFYTAIRVPEAGKSFRAKRMVKEGRAAADKVEKLEVACMKALLDFDKGVLSVEQTLDILEEYDRLITPNREDTRPLLRKTLETAPWRKCDCEICVKDGIQVIIFRGNNRNRRRGFHNTYVFYKLLQGMLNGENIKAGWEDTEETALNGQLPLFPYEEAEAFE